MKYLLVLSVILNFWFQFSENVFEKYVDLKYCKNSQYESLQSGEYEILGLNLFHVHHVIDIYENFDTVTCKNHTGNNPKSNHRN